MHNILTFLQKKGILFIITSKGALMSTPEILELIGQIIGIIAVCFSFLTYQLKTKRGILLMLSLATVLFCTHYALLSAPVGLFLNIVGIIRNLCYYHSDKKILSSKAVPVILAAIMQGVLLRSNSQPFQYSSLRSHPSRRIPHKSRYLPTSDS